MTQASPQNSGETETAADGRSRKTLLVYLFGALGGLNWGYDTGVISRLDLCLAGSP